MAAKPKEGESVTVVLKEPDAPKPTLAKQVEDEKDLSAAVYLIRDSVERHKATPPSTKQNKAMRRFWGSIMEEGQKARKLYTLLDRLADPANFTRDKDDRSVALKEELLPAVKKQISALYVGLTTARDRYHRARPVWNRNILVGMFRASSAPIGTKAAIRAWREAAEKAARDAATATRKRYEDILQKILDDLARVTAQLDGEVEAVKALADRIQRAEHARLKALLPGATAAGRRTKAEELLRQMDDGRIVLRKYEGDASSQYSVVWTKRWQVHRDKVVALLNGAE